MADEVEIPPELLMNHHKKEACMDKLSLNGEGILKTFEKTVRFHSSVHTKHTLQMSTLALYLIIKHYNKGILSNFDSI